ncbi:MAG TPA: hypothetical protein VNK96_02630 [Fimbriimonadales bacterium]|nr:hypothetical protein [Fimbriimonadales bacterium]
MTKAKKVSREEEKISKRLAHLLYSAQNAYLVFLFILLLTVAFISLKWRIQHDLPAVLYPGYLFMQGNIPYKEIFDINFPGSFFLYGFLAKFIGIENISLRLFDLLMLFLLSWMGWVCFGPINKKGTLFGISSFGLFYLGDSWWLSLQREVFILLFLLFSLVLLLKNSERYNFIRFGMIGLLGGCSALIKPHALLGFLWIVIWDGFFRKPKDSAFGKRWVFAFCGFIVPWALTIIYFQKIGALRDWLDLTVNYLPLYGSIAGNIEVVEGSERLLRILQGLLLTGGMFAFAGVSLLSGIVGLREHQEGRSRVLLLLGLAFAYWLYPVIPGQFWLYHWIPFVYFACLLGGLSFFSMDAPRNLRPTRVLLLAGVVLTSSLLFPTRALKEAISETNPRELARVDEMVAFLKPRLKPGDNIQPLDWTGGAIHAMLILRAKLATRYMQDFHFYHHISHPYIQSLRLDFITKLEREKPKFVIRVLSPDKPWVFGPDTTKEFPELNSFLSKEYVIVKEGTDYQILERKH